MHLFHHRPFISFVIHSLKIVTYIDYYSSRSTTLIWQQNVLCTLQAVRERERERITPSIVVPDQGLQLQSQTNEVTRAAELLY